MLKRKSLIIGAIVILASCLISVANVDKPSLLTIAHPKEIASPDDAIVFDAAGGETDQPEAGPDCKKWELDETKLVWTYSGLSVKSGGPSSGEETDDTTLNVSAVSPGEVTVSVKRVNYYKNKDTGVRNDEPFYSEVSDEKKVEIVGVPKKVQGTTTIRDAGFNDIVGGKVKGQVVDGNGDPLKIDLTTVTSVSDTRAIVVTDAAGGEIEGVGLAPIAIPGRTINESAMTDEDGKFEDPAGIGAPRTYFTQQLGPALDQGAGLLEYKITMTLTRTYKGNHPCFLGRYPAVKIYDLGKTTFTIVYQLKKVGAGFTLKVLSVTP